LGIIGHGNQGSLKFDKGRLTLKIKLAGAVSRTQLLSRKFSLYY